jgi:hypothetical protein
LINLGFLTEGKLAAILIIPSSWGSQWAGHSPRTRTVCSHINYTHQLIFWRLQREAANFLALLPGRKRRLLRGEFFAHTSFTLLLFCFTLFILSALLYIKKPKKLESLVVVFIYLLLVLLK